MLYTHHAPQASLVWLVARYWIGTSKADPGTESTTRLNRLFALSYWIRGRDSPPTAPSRPAKLTVHIVVPLLLVTCMLRLTVSAISVPLTAAVTSGVWQLVQFVLPSVRPLKPAAAGAAVAPGRTFPAGAAVRAALMPVAAVAARPLFAPVAPPRPARCGRMPRPGRVPELARAGSALPAGLPSRPSGSGGTMA